MTGVQTCALPICFQSRYIRLNEYVNLLGENAQGDWVFFWNDDSLMLTDGWDQEVLKHDPTTLKLLRIPCQNMNHPFALMPIIPRVWIDFFGCISPVSHSDWWIFNVCYPNQLVFDIDALFYHDRADVTGGNNDETFAERSYSADGRDPSNPYDYVHPQRQHELREWIKKLSEYYTEKIRTYYKDLLNPFFDDRASDELRLSLSLKIIGNYPYENYFCNIRAFRYHHR